MEIEVNKHFLSYITDWDSEIYFLVGGYGSSKSYHTALKILLKLAQEKRTALVVREVYETIRDTRQKNMRPLRQSRRRNLSLKRNESRRKCSPIASPL